MKTGVIFVLLLVFVTVILAGCTGSSQAPRSGDIVIGVLIPLTGDWGSKGVIWNASTALAAEDVNRYMEQTGSDKRVRLIVEDTGTDPATALEKIKTLQQEGARIVVGPASSAEINAVRGWADEHGILVLGYASTAPSLAIENDNVYRLVPDDRRQGDAMAGFMQKSGVTVVIPVFRNDTWGRELMAATRSGVEKNGGIMKPGFAFEPGTRDFGGIAESLDKEVTGAMRQYGNNSVGVYAIGFDETVPLLAAAAGYPGLSSVRWFGSDGSVNSVTLVHNSTAAKFAEETGFYSPAYGEGSHPGIANQVDARIREKSGVDPDPYSLVVYDATEIAARALLSSGDAPLEQLKNALTLTSGYYYGATGWTKLVASGDRAFAVYNFRAVKDVNGTPEWVQVARYEGEQGQPGRFTEYSL